jgi:hypothetical protein
MKVEYKPTLSYHAKFWRKQHKNKIEFDNYVELLYKRLETKNNGQTTRNNK